MANEITVSGSLKIVKNGVTNTLALSSTTFDQTGDARVCGVQAIGTSEEEILFADMAAGNIGWAAFKNLDATNFVDIGTATGVYIIRLEATEAAWFRFVPGTTSVFCLADTAAVNLEYFIGED